VKLLLTAGWPAEAVILADEAAEKLPICAVKLADVAPAGIVTICGTLTLLLLLERVTTNPVRGAGPEISSRHKVLPGELKVPGVQVTRDSEAGKVGVLAVRLNTTLLDAPFRVAVIVAFEDDEKLPAVAVKTAEFWPDGTTTEAGTATTALSSANRTDVPPPGAAFVSATVQVLFPAAWRVDGLQLNAETTGSWAAGVKVTDVVA
jgi:hypothetical protein